MSERFLEMTFKVSRLLSASALVAIPVGAAGSVALMLRAGQRNGSRLLMFLFALWVLAPFVAILWANLASKRWQVFTRATLYGGTLVLALVSLTVYGYVALGPPRAQTAFAFVVVPPISGLLTLLAVWMAAFLSSGESKPQ
jgi:hypothetical protein